MLEGFTRSRSLANAWLNRSGRRREGGGSVLGLVSEYMVPRTATQ